MIKIEINGQLVEAQEGDMLIDVADNATIAIPRFCYHKKLSIAANCRMCLVEVEGAPKPVPACATPVTDGMKVDTKSPRALSAQKAVMEFLLINHPLDCPICDQGGECELQDVAMDYGSDVSQYTEAKRILGDRDIGPLISTDMTRCIHCTRCVRFGEEVAGLKELGATGRSEWMEIGTYIKKSVVSELSGNVIDLCPVGALTSRPFRYKARAWELKSYPSIAPHDSLGSNLLVHTRNGEVMRVVPDENEAINETWLSDRDRFSYEALNSESRLKSPQIKDGVNWKEVDWEFALENTVAELKPYLNTPDSIAILLSPNLTLEELYLVRKLAKSLGIENIEHRLRQQDFSIKGLGLDQKISGKYAELEDEDAILMVGSYLRKEIPLLNNRVRKAQLAGASIFTINPLELDYNFTVKTELINSDLANELAGVTKAACDKAGIEDKILLNITPTQEQESLAQELIDKKSSHIMLGALAQADSNYAALIKLAGLLAKATNSKLSDLPQAANSRGANLIFADSSAESLQDVLADKKVILNLGIEPELDLINTEAAKTALEDAELVINFNSFDSEYQRSYADIMLPIGIFAENAGTYVNAQGDWQSFKVIANSKTEAKPLWKLLRVMGNMLDIQGFEFVNTPEILEEIQQANFEYAAIDFLEQDIKLKAAKSESRVAPYQIDALVRNAKSLQATPDAYVSSQSK